MQKINITNNKKTMLFFLHDFGQFAIRVSRLILNQLKKIQERETDTAEEREERLPD